MVRGAFHNREAELKALEQAWESGRSQLIMTWGRRRTGKTRLLGRFAERRRAVYYGATQQAPEVELRGFSEACRRALPPRPGDLLAHADFASWDTAFEYLAGKSRSRRLLVVLDEFPYLVDGEPGLPSIVQRFWDHAGRASKVKLVLCGSAVSTMERLQAERAPLFGRVDLRLHVRPFGHAEAALFTPGLSPAERTIAYGIVGGLPVYLQRWRDDRGHLANVRALFGDPASPLVDEGEFVLTSELTEAAGYFRILHGIAAGHRTYGKLRGFADIDIQRQLEKLIALGLVERVVPVTENPLRTKRVVYRIADNFLAFWFRFVYRRRSDIARGLGRDVVDRSILPELADYMGDPWEEMCRELIRHRSRDLPVRVSFVGRWWNKDNSVEIDVVGMDGHDVVLAGSAKWARSAGARELDRLRRAAEALPRRADAMRFVLFARERIEGRIPSDVLAFTARDLYG